MVIGHVLPERNESLLEAYEKCRNSADSKSCCDYALHVGVTWWGPKVCQHCASKSTIYYLSIFCFLFDTFPVIIMPFDSFQITDGVHMYCNY